MSWNTIESDAGIFTHLVQDLGVSGVQFSEISVLDSLKDLAGVLYGAIFLFKYDASDYSKSEPMQGAYDHNYPDSLFFANQTIQNACGTLAVINTLLSLSSDYPEEIKLGSTLSEFLSFTSAFKDSELRGESISNSDQIRNVHNSFSSPDPFVMDEKPQRPDRESGEIFHFVSFIEHEGVLYELDGLRPVPIVHREFNNDSRDKSQFAENVIELLQNRMGSMLNSNGKFSVIAIHRDTLDYLHDLKEEGAITDYDYEIGHAQELNKRDAWSKEISLRRQNLYGLVFELMKQVSGSMTNQEFSERVSEAQKTTQERLANYQGRS
ncbi:LANO_0B04214g1_1 [Lachancea nothofagi CBS 11611]|uniref:Ubiquitin carboxyl-terminal hydrolase n=1 Tax=Lachancea nothofagi CBS 11611 TaxID=1266666 RepID=A0A1G4IXE7_9SACH|nr:LANO_0B04214g1_1 [Lachancea nothofagi CBS 11611]